MIQDRDKTIVNLKESVIQAEIKARRFVDQQTKSTFSVANDNLLSNKTENVAPSIRLKSLMDKEDRLPKLMTADASL